MLATRSPTRSAPYLLLLTLLGLGLCFQVHALDVPKLRARVTDDALLLATDEVAALETKLADYERSTGHQFALLIVRGLGGAVIETLSMSVVREPKLGDKRRNDGLLILIALDDHKVRIEVGLGLERAIPDALASKVIADAIVPNFRVQKYALGLSTAFDQLMAPAKNAALAKPSGKAVHK